MSGSPSRSKPGWRTSDPGPSPSSDDDSSIEEVAIVTPAAPAPAAPPRNQEQQLIARRDAHQKELDRLGDEMRRIQERCRNEKKSIEELTRQIGRVPRVNGGGEEAVVDYFGRFEWSGMLREQMVQVFGIGEFRLSQEGVCNANMAGRDIICIMPTGGGKSLTYQLPATLMPGCTLVVSPLVALIRDQDLHLQEKQIECLTFTAKMPLAKINEGYNRLRDTTGKEVKLCYVTPERFAKSEDFRSVVKEMVAADKLTRIVIDEAHCIPQLGRDFRPDYQLADLRKLCPRVPILALSATCPPSILRDLIAILSLPPLTNGTAAKPHGTVLFHSPLYRKNLHYKVLPKSSGRVCAGQEMAKYILERYPNETGIVYCLSREDANRVATQLDKESQGRIKTGIYHAEIDDKVKEDLYESWLSGKVKVVCATTAFGLGINKANVRFVLHHSKSLETFYQESGRAGRDGRDADCILYYRLLDALRTSGMKADTDWQQKEAHTMIEFCLDLKECRKLKFTKHFSSTDFSWTEDNTPCGHCDNCLRDPASVVEKDVTSEAKRVLAVAHALDARDTNFTVALLARTARGNSKLAKSLNLSRGDKVTLSLLDTEVLIAHLLLEGYLEKFPVPGDYGVLVYVKPARSRSFGDDQKLVVQFQLVPNDHSPGKRRRRPRRAADKSPRKSSSSNNNSNNNVSDEEVEGVEDEDEDEDFGDDSGEDSEFEPAGPSENAGGSPAKRRRSNYHAHHGSSRNGLPAVITIDIDESDQEWTVSTPSAQSPTTRSLTRSGRRRAETQKQKQGRGPPPSGAAALLDDEIIEISTD
ncbi:ATP-dependent DNA helicase [Lactarius tabidus]